MARRFARGAALRRPRARPGPTSAASAAAAPAGHVLGTMRPATLLVVSLLALSSVRSTGATSRQAAAAAAAEDELSAFLALAKLEKLAAAFADAGYASHQRDGHSAAHPPLRCAGVPIGMERGCHSMTKFSPTARLRGAR